MIISTKGGSSRRQSAIRRRRVARPSLPLRRIGALGSLARPSLVHSHRTGVRVRLRRASSLSPLGRPPEPRHVRGDLRLHLREHPHRRLHLLGARLCNIDLIGHVLGGARSGAPESKRRGGAKYGCQPAQGARSQRMGPEKSADNARTRLIQPQSLRSLASGLPATRLLTSRRRPPLSASACAPRGETKLLANKLHGFFCFFSCLACSTLSPRLRHSLHWAGRGHQDEKKQGGSAAGGQVKERH